MHGQTLGSEVGEGREGIQQIKFQLWLGKTSPEELGNSRKIQVVLRGLIRLRRCVAWSFSGRTPYQLKAYPAPSAGGPGEAAAPGW